MTARPQGQTREPQGSRREKNKGSQRRPLTVIYKLSSTAVCLLLGSPCPGTHRDPASSEPGNILIWNPAMIPDLLIELRQTVVLMGLFPYV